MERELKLSSVEIEKPEDLFLSEKLQTFISRIDGNPGQPTGRLREKVMETLFYWFLNEDDVENK